MDFLKKFNEINEHTSLEGKKYIHFKSLRNFIWYYSSTKKEKNQITKLLEEYILLIENKNYIFSKEEAYNNYNNYIRPLGFLYYRKHLKFCSVISIHVFIILFLLPNIFIWLIFHNLIFSSTILFFSV